MRRTRTLAAALTCIIGVGALLMVANPAPAVPALSAADTGGSTQPYVVKLHARWCPLCMVTKDVWSEVQEAYAGKARFVVFDFTTAASTEESRLEASRLGLDRMFEAYSGETGTVLVLDGTSKEVKHVLHGTRDPAAYRAAIDAVSAGTPHRSADR